MRWKMHNFIGVVGLLQVGFGGLLSNDVAASSLLGPTTTLAQVPNLDRKHPTQVTAISYSPPTHISDAGSRMGAAIADKSMVSTVPEIDIWTVLIAILGLIGMRLWCGGKKRSSAIY